VTLPRLGTIRTHEPVVKLARKVEDGSARSLSATVSRTAQRWFVSFTVEVERDVPQSHARPGSAVGVDLGVKTLLSGVDDRGRVIEVAGPRPLRGSLRRLRRAGRWSRRTAGTPQARRARDEGQ
jgi:putative transposase